MFIGLCSLVKIHRPRSSSQGRETRWLSTQARVLTRSHSERLRSAARDFCASFQGIGPVGRRRIIEAPSNLWLWPQTYRYWGFQRPMPKRTPPSDDIPLARRCAFPGLVRGVPADRKRYERPNRVVVVRSNRRFPGGFPDERREQRRAHRQAQTCTLQVHCGRLSRSNRFKNSDSSQTSTSVQNCSASKIAARLTARSSSNRACILETLVPAFNGSRRSVTTSKVDRLG